MTQRIDKLLAARGMARSRTHAQRLIEQGRVRVDGRAVDKPSQPVHDNEHVDVLGNPHDDYVGRGAYKLAGALNDFAHLGFDPRGLVCFDAGASTGGFTDVLLRCDAAKVYAVDVGSGQLNDALRHDSRVVVMENTNIRHMRSLDEKPQFFVGDLSFISLTLILPVLAGLAAPGAKFLMLVKPQFEVEGVPKSGVVKDAAKHREALERVAAAAGEAGLTVVGAARSAIDGQHGNAEFFLAMVLNGERSDSLEDGAYAADALLAATAPLDRHRRDRERRSAQA